MSKRRRILITTYLDNAVGFDCYLARIDLAREFGDIIVISNQRSARHVFNLGQKEFIYVPRPGGNIGLCLFLIRVFIAIKKTRPDIVFFLHSVFGVLRGAFPLKPAAWIFWNVHPSQMFLTRPWKSPANGARNLLSGFLYRLAYRGARLCDEIMPIGEELEKDLLAKGAGKGRTKLVYLGVSGRFEPPFKEKPVNNSQPLNLLYTGSLNAERGQDIILAAIKMANSQREVCHLTVVGGDAAFKRSLLAQADSLGIGNYLEVVETLPNSEIPAYMHKADAGLQLWEKNSYFSMNPPTKLFEYLVAGLPPIVNDIATHTGYIRHGDNGFIVNYDPVSLSQIITHIAKDKRVLGAMSERGRRGGEQYLWEHQAKAMREIFSKYAL